MNTPENLTSTSRRILSLQRLDGSIPWTEHGIFDAWNHIESAMGLTVAGELEAAKKAYAYLADTQNKDGSWWGEYGNAAPVGDDARLGDDAGILIRDSNFTAYIATGIWHFYKATGNRSFLVQYWPIVKRALSFALSLQSSYGDIAFAMNETSSPEDDSLKAGCASIYFSLECGIRIANELGVHPDQWMAARQLLGRCLRENTDRFDRTWASKDGFAMDWYYPVLTGVFCAEEASRIIHERWNIFVLSGHGCRCVEEAPWVTTAESCELAISLVKIGNRQGAENMLNWQLARKEVSGAYWMGTDIASGALWPLERPSWTSAAILLAADAIYGLTQASNLFTSAPLEEAPTIRSKLCEAEPVS